MISSSASEDDDDERLYKWEHAVLIEYVLWISQ